MHGLNHGNARLRLEKMRSRWAAYSGVHLGDPRARALSLLSPSRLTKPTRSCNHATVSPQRILLLLPIVYQATSAIGPSCIIAQRTSCTALDVFHRTAGAQIISG